MKYSGENSKSQNSSSSQDEEYNCMFCNMIFKEKRYLSKHLKTSKKCLENRPKTTYNCIWCSQTFIFKDDLNKHYKKCECDKEQLHIDLLNKHNYTIEEKDNQLREKDKQLEEKNNQLEEKDKIIKDLQDKLFSLANKTTINNTTKNYTVNLTCAKPFILSRKRILNLLKTTCNEKYMLQGEIGTAKWFMDHACRNDAGLIALQTTDRRRKTLKYIDEREDAKQITGNNLQKYITKCLNDYRKTSQYNAIADKINDTYKDTDFSKLLKADEFMHPNRKFINYICDETYAKSIEDDDDIDEDIHDAIYDDDITDEEHPTIRGVPYQNQPDFDMHHTITVEPCFPHIWKEATGSRGRAFQDASHDDFLYN